MTSSNSTEAKKVDRRSHRGWMITINNPKIPCDAYLAQWLSDGNIVFGCGQLEKGEEGTLHHQMYVVTKPNPSNKNGFTLKWMKDNIHSSAHFQGREGTHDQAVAYCTSEEYKGKSKGRQDGPWTVGAWDAKHTLTTEEKSKGGKVNSSKILAVKRKIDDGAHDAELYDEHFGEMLRYGKAFERYRVAVRSKHRTWQTTAIALFGPPGTGKSKHAWDLAIANYGEDDVYPLSLEGGDTVWWDGYCGQKCVIVEEFYGQMKIAYLLKLLDRYPLLVQTKGGMTPFVASMIIFTSNEHPKMWYGKGAEPGAPSKIPLDVLRALDRRFDTTLGCIKELKEVFTGPVNQPNMLEVLEMMEKGVVAAAVEQQLPPIVDLTESDGEHSQTSCEHADGYICDLCLDVAADEMKESVCDDCHNVLIECVCNEHDQDAVGLGHDEIPLSQARRMRFENQEDFERDWPEPAKLRRTDSAAAAWQLTTPKTSSGVYRPTGPGKVQASLSFKKTRPVVAGTPHPSGTMPDADDDEDVDDKVAPPHSQRRL